MAKDRNEQRRPGGGIGVVRLVMLGLAAAAVAKELRTDPARRTWNGVVAGLVPYDFRMPTFERFQARVWNPDDERWVTPRVWGVGWTVNVGRIAAVVRENYVAP